MTTELEKQFFDTFGIEPHKVYPPQDELFGSREEMTEFFEEAYPQITDSILLELICLISQHITYIDTIEKFKTVEELKTLILEEVIYQYKHYGTKNTIKHQVQAIFEGER